MKRYSKIFIPAFAALLISFIFIGRVNASEIKEKETVITETSENTEIENVKISPNDEKDHTSVQTPEKKTSDPESPETSPADTEASNTDMISAETKNETEAQEATAPENLENILPEQSAAAESAAEAPLKALQNSPARASEITFDGEYFRDGDSNIIKNVWVRYEGFDYFPDGNGKLYRGRVITFGSDIAYYMGDDGKKQDGVHEFEGSVGLFDPLLSSSFGDLVISGRINKSNSWVNYDSRDYFPNKNGLLYCGRTITFGNDTAYFMGNDGSKQYGVQKINGNYYLCDPELKMMFDGVEIGGIINKSNSWVSYEGDYYFPNSDGIIYHDRIITFGPKISYFIGSECKKETGFKSVKGDMYLFDRNLSRKFGDRDISGMANCSNSWIRIDEKDYFPNAQGKLYRNREISFGPKISYFLGADGSRYTGIKRIGASLRLYDPNLGQLFGSLFVPGIKNRANAWVEYEGEKYFPDAQGELYHDRIITFGPGKAYYMGHDGSMQKELPGLVKVNGRYVFKDKNGKIYENIGIDLSEWNEITDWNAVKNEGVQFVISRAGGRFWGSGRIYDDSEFKNFLDAAKAQGMKRGAYFFSAAVNKAEAAAEASFVIKKLAEAGHKDIEMPIFIDVEPSSDGEGRADNLGVSALTDVVVSFCETIANAGYTPGIYANANYYDCRLDRSRISKYKIWLAHWGLAKKGEMPDYMPFDVWQLSSEGSIKGSAGSLDINLMI